MPFTGDAETIVGDIQEFVTGERESSACDLERVLATVMFTAISSIPRAAPLKWAISNGADCSTTTTELRNRQLRSIAAI